MRKTVVIGALLALSIAGCAKTGENGHLHTYGECRTEDSISCVWHANLHGNGQGDSFYTHRDGTRTYFTN